MPAYVVAPVTIGHVGGRVGKISLVFERCKVGMHIAREAYGIAVIAQPAPTVKCQGATILAVQLHVVIKHVVQPKSIAQFLRVVNQQFLLPVEPPEVHADLFMRTEDMLEKGFVEILVLQLPGYLLVGRQVQLLRQRFKIVLIGINTAGGVQVEG